MDATMFQQFVALVGVPNNFAGEILIWCMMTVLIAVFITCMFCMPFFLFSRK